MVSKLVGQVMRTPAQHLLLLDFPPTKISFCFFLLLLKKKLLSHLWGSFKYCEVSLEMLIKFQYCSYISTSERERQEQSSLVMVMHAGMILTGSGNAYRNDLY